MERNGLASQTGTYLAAGALLVTATVRFPPAVVASETAAIAPFCTLAGNVTEPEEPALTQQVVTFARRLFPWYGSNPDVAVLPAVAEEATAAAGHRVRVGDRDVLALRDRATADAIAAQLQPLATRPASDTEEPIRPGFAAGQPAVFAGDRLLFALDPRELATPDPTIPADDYAIAWTDAIRLALDLDPLPEAARWLRAEPVLPVSGFASWYGPGLGNLTRRGDGDRELYGQLAVTPALPVLEKSAGKRSDLDLPETKAADESASHCLDLLEIGILPDKGVVLQAEPTASDPAGAGE